MGQLRPALQRFPVKVSISEVEPAQELTKEFKVLGAHADNEAPELIAAFRECHGVP